MELGKEEEEGLVGGVGGVSREKRSRRVGGVSREGDSCLVSGKEKEEEEEEEERLVKGVVEVSSYRRQ